MPRLVLPPISAEETAALERDERFGASYLLRRRAQIVLSCYATMSQTQTARALRCSLDTVQRTLSLYRHGGRGALRPRPRRTPSPWRKVDLAWLKALALAMEQGPEACGVARPTWTAPLLSIYLEEQLGIAVSERTVRRGLEQLGYVCRRPTWTVRHKAEEQEHYAPKRPGSKRS